MNDFCSADLNFICDFPQRPLLRLRGACNASFLDVLYYPLFVPDAADRKNGGELLWAGTSNTYIRYNQTALSWVARAAGSPGWAECRVGLDRLVLGRQTWAVHDEQCYADSLASVQLSLTRCTDHEFNCDDGSCIQLDRRCDGRKGAHLTALNDDI